MLCWTRDTTEQVPSEHWQAEQLKLIRGALDRKTSLCDELATELRRAQADLDEKNAIILEVRSSLASSNQELRASTAKCAHCEEELEQLKEQLAALSPQSVVIESKRACSDSLVEEVERLRAQVAALTSQSEGSPRHSLAPSPLIEEFEQVKREKVDLELQLVELQDQRKSNCEELEQLRARVVAIKSQSAEVPNPRTDPALLTKDSSQASAVVPNLLIEELEQLRSQLSALPEDTTIKDLVLSAKSASERDVASQAEILQEKSRCADALQLLQAARAEANEKMLEFDMERKEAVRLLQATRSQADEKLNEVIKEREEALRLLQVTRAEADEKLIEVSKDREEALRLLQAARAETDEKVSELNKELKLMSMGLEQREEDVLSIQFDMAALQNQLSDQANLVKENAESFQWASEELAEKDEKFDEAVKQLETQRLKQEELSAQIDEASVQFQAKIAELSQDLETNRAAYRALEEQTTKVVSRLEAERDAMAIELERHREESKLQTATLRAESQKREEVAAEVRHRLENELSSALESLRQERQQRTEDLAVLQLQSLQNSYAGGLNTPVMPSSPELVMPTSLEPDVPRSPQLQRELEEKIAVGAERLALAEAKIQEYATALERSRLLERQALEQAEECRTALDIQRESVPSPRRESQLFAAASPRRDASFREETVLDIDTGVVCTSELPTPVTLPNVLIAVELFLGEGIGTAVLAVAPWQTRSDFHEVVDDFLREHHVKPMFGEVLVQYLEDVEKLATSFPTRVKASLADLYGRYA